jgi:hypothetical protein
MKYTITPDKRSGHLLKILPEGVRLSPSVNQVIDLLAQHKITARRLSYDSWHLLSAQDVTWFCLLLPQSHTTDH